jgi:quercetin dioxygenase-like cupin family protein
VSDHPVMGDLGLAPVEEVDPSRVVDLVAEGGRLLDQARSSGRGRAVRAVVRQPGQNMILLGLPAGGGLPEHDAPGPASLLCLSGEVVLSTADASWTLPAGAAHAIPPVRHDVRAVVDSVCVLTVSLPR